MHMAIASALTLVDNKLTPVLGSSDAATPS
jgi:hypothetical protein